MMRIDVTFIGTGLVFLLLECFLAGGSGQLRNTSSRTPMLI
jgi:hypothetical protein